MNIPKSVSVVIPTKNRKDYITQCLNALKKEAHLIEETLIVDSSDTALQLADFSDFKDLNISIIHSESSVCVQRNIGIKKAKSPYIFLLDDDIEISENYINACLTYLSENDSNGAACGYFMEKDGDDNWQYQYPVKNMFTLIWAYLFNNSLWFDFNENVQTYKPKFLFNYISKTLQSRQNTFSKAGWPINISLNQPINNVSVYSLGACIVKKSWLIKSLYDEVLDPHGLGDNYGVALGFPQEKPISILSNVLAFHHRSKQNRLDKSKAYYRRVLALHYFITRSKKFNKTTNKYFLLSLVGNFYQFILKLDLLKARLTGKLIWKILRKKNPYILAKEKGLRIITPKI